MYLWNETIKMNESLQFRGNNPGAVQYGNFINYYQFNLPENRLEVFPVEVLDEIANNSTKVFCLDIGCNTGVYTHTVKKHSQFM